jgi:thiamine biosynthesis lipoprotein
MLLTPLHQSLLLLLALAVTGNHPAQVQVERSANAMGTVFSVAMYGSDVNKLATAGDLALAEARRIDRLLSNYKPDSELSKVNAEAARKPVHVSMELFDLLLECGRVSQESEGAFDITVGPLMKAWGFFRGAGQLPGQDAIREARARVGYQNILLDPKTRTVRFQRAGVELDPGGVGKGYAVDRMAAILRQQGVATALISGGGSSIYGIGCPPDEVRGWPVHIADPRNDRKTAADVFLKNMSLSTSGSYEKFFWADGKVYSHIMDPRTGFPAQGTLAVSVIAPTTLASELWAKPYFILGSGWTARHKPTYFRVFFCSAIAGSACYWIS